MSDDGRSAMFRVPEHVRRMFDSAHIPEINIPFNQRDMIDACVEIVRVNRLTECYIRPIVFLGEGEMGVSARSNQVRVAIAAWPWGAYLGDERIKRGARLKTSSF